MLDLFFEQVGVVYPGVHTAQTKAMDIGFYRLDSRQLILAITVGAFLFLYVIRHHLSCTVVTLTKL